MGSAQAYTWLRVSAISCTNCWENITAAADVITKRVGGAVSEAASNHRPDRTAPVSLSKKSATHHGNILLAFFGFSNLGIYHSLPGALSKSGSRIHVVFSRGAHSLGYAVPIAAGHHDFVPGRTVGPQSDESVCKPAEAERVPCGHHGHEHHESRMRLHRHGRLRGAVLLLQRPGHRIMADSLRVQPGRDGMGDRGLHHVAHYAIRTRSGSAGLEHGVSVSTDLLCVLPHGSFAGVAEADRHGQSGGPYIRGHAHGARYGCRPAGQPSLGSRSQRVAVDRRD